MYYYQSVISFSPQTLFRESRSPEQLEHYEKPMNYIATKAEQETKNTFGFQQEP